jgi:hypothetical protein
VQPAKLVNSPAESVVGIDTVRIPASVFGRRVTPSGPVTARSPSSARASAIPLARHIPTILAASVTEPPPSVTSRSAPAARAAFAAATTSMRGVCAPIRVHVPARWFPNAACARATKSVSRDSVPPAIRNTRPAPSRARSSASAPSKSRPNSTRSMFG